MTVDYQEPLRRALRIVGRNEIALVIVAKPGQRTEGLSIADNDSVVLRINALAQEGRANERVVSFLAEILGCPKRDISVARGQLSRHKEIRIRNARIEEVIKTLLGFVRAHGEPK